MPMFDEELRDRIARSVPTVPNGDDPLEAIVRRKGRRVVTRKVGTIATVAVLLLGTIGAFALVSGRSTETPQPADTGTPPPVANLGLPYPVCHVSTMPITTTSGPGTASVFTRADGGCPKEGEGSDDVGVDVNGDGVLDATWGPLPDCYFPCEAFAAPDVNGDGVSEIAVSTEGADGYGVSMYAVTTSPPSIEPITVSSTYAGPPDGKPLQFAWVDVYTHASSAGCGDTGDQGPFFQLYSTEKLTPARVQTTSILIEGSTATVTGISNDTMPLGEAPLPGTELCGTPIYGSAAGLGAYVASATCDVTTMSGDVDGDGTSDTLSIGTIVSADLSCPSHGTRILTIDLGAEGTFDVRTGPPDCSTWCVAFALADLNHDGVAEILLNEGHLAPPVSAEIGVYELRDGMLQPVSFPDGKNRFPLQNSWQGYLGAYCTNPTSFWLWEGATDANGTLQSSSGTAYRLNVDALAFVQVVTSSGDGIPAETGYDGRLCGAATQPLG
jgi:hypothetical protein